MAVDPGSIFQFSVAYRDNGQILRNFFHYRNETLIPVLNGFQAADELVNGLMSDDAGDIPSFFAACMSTEVTIEEASVQLIHPQRWRVAKFPMALVGTQAGSSDAQNLQASVEKFTAVANRRSHGGVRVGGLSRDTYADGFITNDLKAALTALASNIFIQRTFAFSTSNTVLEPVVVNRTKTVVNGKDTWPITGSTIVMGALVHDEVRTQRTRTIGRGE
jgi:hypothetical protein